MSFGYAVYFTEREKHRVVRWEPDSGNVDVVAGEKGKDDPSQALNHPYGLAFDSGGSLLIADKINHRICRLQSGRLWPLHLSDPDQTRKRLPDSHPAYSPLPLCPTALFMEPIGSFLCTFADDCTIYRIRTDLSLEHVLGILPRRSYLITGYPEVAHRWEVADTPIHIPTGIVKRRDGTVYFIERKPQLVRAYHPDSGLRSLFPFVIPGEFRRPPQAPNEASITTYHPQYPGCLAIDQDDVLYLTEVAQSCVLRIDVDTGAVRKVIEIDRPGGIKGVGVAALGFGPDGTAWILNTVNQAVEAYKPTKTGLWKSLGERLTQLRGENLKLPVAGSGIALGR